MYKLCGTVNKISGKKRGKIYLSFMIPALDTERCLDKLKRISSFRDTVTETGLVPPVLKSAQESQNSEMKLQDDGAEGIKPYNEYGFWIETSTPQKNLFSIGSSVYVWVSVKKYKFDDVKGWKLMLKKFQQYDI